VEPPSRDRAALTPGTFLHDKYVIGELLGHGGSGTVHRAHAPSIRRDAAIKVQSDASSVDPSMRRRFVQEMRLLAAIDHPGIVDVFEMGRLPGGHLVAALELLEGSTLRDVLRVQRVLTPLRALDLTMQLCSALAAVHRHGVVHRDLKPGNIIVLSDRRGTRAKLIDFGIARSYQEMGEPITTPAEVVGTPGYLAPERVVLGMPVDGRCDLFALGVVLFEMLVGERPFGTTPAALARGLAEGPARLRRALSELVSSELAATLLALLESDPSARPSSAEEVLERLARVPEADGVVLASSPSVAPAARPHVMVISESPRQRDVWSRAVRGAGGHPIPLADVQTAVMLLRHESHERPPFVMLSALEDAAGELHTLGVQRLRRIIYVDQARLEHPAPGAPHADARAQHIAMPVTEADLRAVLVDAG
jgi:serine/threonine-protein kinase